MGTTAVWCIWLFAAYLVGSIPFGLLIGLAKGVDIRKSGSGNVGATNTGRVLGKTWGLTCFLLDVLKGTGPTLGYGLATGLASVSTGAEPAVDPGGATALLSWLAVAVAAVLGHVFPVWLKFKGGKGVATALGVLLGFWPVLTLPGLAGGILWLIIVKSTGYVSLGSVAAACALPVLVVISSITWGRSPGETAVYTAVTGLLAALITLRHRGNIQRLRQGNESKVQWASKARG